MSTYISSKKILSKVINLALLLSTTHFVLIEPVLAFEEDSIDLEEKFTEVSPENLSQDFEAMKGIAKETYEKTYENGSRIVEEVQAKIEDILNVDNIKTNRDAALSQAALEKTERKRIEEKVSKLEETLDQEKTKLTNKEGKISQLKKKLKERKLAQELLKKELEETKKKQADEISAAESFKAQTTQGLKNIEQTYKEIQTERDAFKTKCQADIANLKKEHEEKMQEARDEGQSKNSELETELTKKYQADIVKLQEKYEEKIQEARDEGQSKNSELKTELTKKYQADIVKLQEKYEEKIQEARDEGEKKNSSLETELTKKYQADVEKLQEKYEKKIQEARDEGEKKNSSLETELTKKYQTDIANLKKEHEKKIQEARDEGEKKNSSLETELTKKCQTDIANLKKEHEKKIQEARDEGEKKNSSLETELTKKYQTDIANLKKEHEKKIQEARDEGEKKNSSLETELTKKHEEEIKTLSEEWRSKRTKLKGSIAEKERLLSEKEIQIGQLTESLADSQKDYNAKQADITNLKKEYEEEIKTLSKQLLDAQQGQVALLEESSTASQEDYNTAQEDLNTLRENDVQDQFSQSRELDTNSLDDVSTQEISPQTVDRGKSMSSVMNDSIEASANQLYDNISSRFSWNDHISSGDERGQLEIWVKQGAGVVSQKPTEQIKEGYKGRSHGLFIGIDRTFGLGDKNLIGAAIALNNKSKMQLRSSRGQLSTDSNIVSVYGKHHLNSQLALSGAVSYFRANTEAENFGENIDKIKMHGTRFDLELSYNKICGNQLWQPFVGASYSQISAFDINFKDQRVVIKTKKSRLLSGKIGTRVQLKQYSLENGINISPSLMASISKPLKIISGNRFMVNNNILSEDNNLLTHEIKDAMLNLGGDLRINRNNIDIIGSYNFSIRKKYQSHQGAIKVEVKL